MAVLVALFTIMAVTFGLLLRSREQRVDAPARLLVRATGLMPADRVEWGKAMTGELQQVDGAVRRWRFALGCLFATFFVRRRPGTGDRLVAPAVLVAAAGGLGMVAYAVLRYPGVVTSGGAWAALAVFAVVLAGFVLAAFVMARRGPAGSGLIGGLVVSAVWVVCGVTIVGPASRPGFPLITVVLLVSALPSAPLVVGAVAGWRSGRAGLRTPCLAAVVAGLAIFLVLAGDALLTAGGPYDAGLVRDFPASGLPDLATYAVSDNLGTAMNLLLVVSAMTAALGSAAAAVTARIHRRRSKPPSTQPI